MLVDTHSRGYGYTSPSHRGPYPPPPPPYNASRRAPPDPHTFDYPATLKQYAEWFRYYYPQQASEEDSADKAAEQEAGDGSKPRNGIRSRWEKYKKDFAAQQVSTTFIWPNTFRVIIRMVDVSYLRCASLSGGCVTESLPLCCSCNGCSIIIESRLGSLKSMTLLLSLRRCVRECASSAGRAVWTYS